ncbi:MAG: BppU family phage baseplate upper protein [Solobacterium sp.]|nr:BppU family phage baseplate upper protein [Solobacterium sp.]
MAINANTITLDLNPTYRKKQTVWCSQLDNVLRTLAVTLTDGGIAYDVGASGYDVYIEGTKPDKKGFSYKVTDIGGSVSGSVVTVPVQTQMTAVKGVVETEIVLKSGTDRIGSANFLLVVETAGLADDVDVSETELPAYIDGAQQAAREAEESARKAQALGIVSTVGASNPLTIIDGADGIPVVNLLAQIDYKASGWTGCNIVGYSAYPFDKTVFSDANTSIKTKLLSGKPNTTYVAVTNLPLASGGAANVFVSANSTSPTTGNAGVWQGNNRTFTTDADGIIKVLYRTTGLPSGKTLLDYDYAIVESGTGTTYAFNWSTVAGTVYGGTLDVTTGVLTSTLASDGSALANPVTYQLTPTEVDTLLQGNSFTCNCGNLTITYYVDLKTYIDNAIATAVASL